MRILYDTDTVHPYERYDYYRAGAGTELAPVAAHGHPPRSLRAAMSVSQIGEFSVETISWAADSEIVAQRTERLIRAQDPECYRIFLSIEGSARMEQAGNQLCFRNRDMALYDLSRPWRATHPTSPQTMRVVMLTFSRTLMPMNRAKLRPMLGTAIPRGLPGRSSIAQWLIELTDDLAAERQCDPEAADVLRECTLGLVRQRLGQTSGIAPATWRLLNLTRVRGIIRRNLHDPRLSPEQIAKAASISVRYLHKIFEHAELTPMQLVKRMRLEECHRALHDPAKSTTSIKELVAECGYHRQDQFARDFRLLFGMSATQVRHLAL